MAVGAESGAWANGSSGGLLPYAPALAAAGSSAGCHFCVFSPVTPRCRSAFNGPLRLAFSFVALEKKSAGHERRACAATAIKSCGQG